MERVSNNNEPDHCQCVPKGGDLVGSAEALCRFIDEHRLLDSENDARRPLVVLAFDEARVLTDNPPDKEYWNVFTELRRYLRFIRDVPIFSLFLSTAGCLN